MRLLFSLLSLAAVVGCASKGPTPVATTAPVQVASAASATAPARQTCHKEITVGTNMPHTVCESGSGDMDDQNIARNVDQMNRANGFQQGVPTRAGVGN